MPEGKVLKPIEKVDRDSVFYGDDNTSLTPTEEERGPVSKFFGAATEDLGSVIGAAKDLYGTVTGDPKARARTGQRAVDFGKGILNEPRRMVEELQSTFRSAMQGDPGGSMYHLAGTVPYFGPKTQQIADDISHGGTAEALGHGVNLAAQTFAPAYGGEAARMVAEPVSYVPSALKGAWKGAIEPTTINRYGFKVPLPQSAVNAAAGSGAGELIGRPWGLQHELGGAGAIIGGGTPIVKGAVKGIKEEMTARKIAKQRASSRVAPWNQPHESMRESPVTQGPIEKPELTSGKKVGPVQPKVKEQRVPAWKDIPQTESKPVPKVKPIETKKTLNERVPGHAAPPPKPKALESLTDAMKRIVEKKRKAKAAE